MAGGFICCTSSYDIFMGYKKRIYNKYINTCICKITTFILMYFFNISINVISLSGLVLGVGMMVDNSIVVLENIFYYSNYYSKYNINKNDKRTIKINNIKSSIIGTSEVSIAITASTLTSVCVFLPFLFVKGQMGQMFSDLCITVSISLLTSLFVALTIVPLLASRLNKLNPDSKLNLLLKKSENFFNKNLHNNVEKFYVSILAIVIKNKKKSFALISILLTISLFLLLMNIGKEGYPVSDEGTIISRLRLPVGARVEFTDMFINKMEHDIESAVSNNMAYYETRVRTGRNEHHGEVRVKLVDREAGRKSDISYYIENIRNKAAACYMRYIELKNQYYELYNRKIDDNEILPDYEKLVKRKCDLKKLKDNAYKEADDFSKGLKKVCGDRANKEKQLWDNYKYYKVLFQNSNDRVTDYYKTLQFLRDERKKSIRELYTKSVITLKQVNEMGITYYKNNNSNIKEN